MTIMMNFQILKNTMTLACNRLNILRSVKLKLGGLTQQLQIIDPHCPTVFTNQNTKSMIPSATQVDIR